jgi:predicted nucleic-acid-binding Zn-ribbon protein
MRTGRCPKCNSERIAVTKYTLYLGAGVSGPRMALYACAACRYAENYLEDSVEERVQILDSWRWVKPTEGPFRT